MAGRCLVQPLAEEMIRQSVQKATGGLLTKYDLVISVYEPEPGDEELMKRFSSNEVVRRIDFSSFRRMTMKEAISEFIFKEYNFMATLDLYLLITAFFTFFTSGVFPCLSLVMTDSMSSSPTLT